MGVCFELMSSDGVTHSFNSMLSAYGMTNTHAWQYVNNNQSMEKNNENDKKAKTIKVTHDVAFVNKKTGSMQNIQYANKVPTRDIIHRTPALIAHFVFFTSSSSSSPPLSFI